MTIISTPEYLAEVGLAPKHEGGESTVPVDRRIPTTAATTPQRRDTCSPSSLHVHRGVTWTESMHFPKLMNIPLDDQCGSWAEGLNGHDWFCDRMMGHTGRHHAAGSDWILRVWSDESVAQ